MAMKLRPKGHPVLCTSTNLQTALQTYRAQLCNSLPSWGYERNSTASTNPLCTHAIPSKAKQCLESHAQCSAAMSLNRRDRSSHTLLRARQLLQESPADAHNAN